MNLLNKIDFEIWVETQYNLRVHLHSYVNFSEIEDHNKLSTTVCRPTHNCIEKSVCMLTKSFCHNYGFTG